MSQSWIGYAANASRLIATYNALDVAALYAPVAGFTPRAGERVLDVGAGTGRDAAHWHALGCDVTAVDPVPELWTQADLICHKDHLPELRTLADRPAGFDVITVIGVMHHLHPDAQTRSLARFAALLSPGGRVLLSLRHGPTPEARPGYGIETEEMISQAASCGFTVSLRKVVPSLQPMNIAAGVRWTWLVLGTDQRGRGTTSSDNKVGRAL